jgi:hypothetical protein
MENAQSVSRCDASNTPPEKQVMIGFSSISLQSSQMGAFKRILKTRNGEGQNEVRMQLLLVVEGRGRSIFKATAARQMPLHCFFS